jgi:hypothetical protein
MMRRTRFEAMIDKKEAVNIAEEKGLIVDSIEIRKALLEKVREGKISLEEAQSQLKKIKSGAKKKGLITRHQAWSRG